MQDDSSHGLILIGKLKYSKSPFVIDLFTKVLGVSYDVRIEYQIGLRSCLESKNYQVGWYEGVA